LWKAAISREILKIGANEGVDVQCRGGRFKFGDTFLDLLCDKSTRSEHADQHDGKCHQKKLPGKASLL
jgi:hypothetical protein